MNYKKLPATAVFILGAWMSVGVGASTWNPQNNAVYSTSVNGTPYDFSYLTGNFTDNSTLLQSQPWRGNEALAGDFATAVGGYFGPPPNYGYGPLFSYSAADSYNLAVALDDKGGTYRFPARNDIDYVYAVATPTGGGGAPEIDGSLAPKVGFLLGCLFLMFGRKKQNLESMMAA